MTTQFGRNDPCHCGSGKKYKHCHLRLALAQPAVAAPPEYDGAAPLAIAWLGERHRKAFRGAVETLYSDLWPEGSPPGKADIDPDSWQAIQINLTEWLLAEGQMQVKGEQRNINAHLLGPDGPRLNDAQRAWLEQMARRPLRLYTVTDVRAGEGLTLCDALAGDAAPQAVQERMGSQSAKPGLLIGARVMTVADHLELSGSIYPFSALAKPTVLADARAIDESGDHADNRALLMGRAIARAWVRQFVLPPPMPKIMDASTGEPMLLVTDHYCVLDATALARALAACDDVAGDAQSGWRRELQGEDRLVRSLAAINPGKKADRIEVFYRTQRMADEGRTWFDGVAGTAVQYLTREITDPQAAMRSPGGAAPPRRSELSPEQRAYAIEQMLRQTYARWPDEPIPMLDGKTPRQAVLTPAGLERVKGLLRSYESGEAEMAARDGRRSISYQFLWDAMGIVR